jgi:hypothetical protein
MHWPSMPSTHHYSMYMSLNIKTFIFVKFDGAILVPTYAGLYQLIHPQNNKVSNRKRVTIKLEPLRK